MNHHPRPPIAFKSPGRHGYAVEFSPYLPQRLAVATAQHYGIAGTGTLFLIDITPAGAVLLGTFDWKEGLFDLTWSESNERLVMTGSGDGSIQLWDINIPAEPVKVFKEHSREVYSVNWNQTRDQNFVLSASWDKTIKLWDTNRDHSLQTFVGHRHNVYSAVWSPLVPGCFASSSGDGSLCVWDIRKPQKPRFLIPVSKADVISCDWCKYDQNIIVAGSVDCKIRGWDLRYATKVLFQLGGHTHAIRRIKCSPHSKTVLASSSYDFTVRTWDFARQPTPLEIIENHTEFVCGLDFNVHVPGQLADCAWDERTVVYVPKSLAAFNT
ncbi:peroxisomal targeting signal 2 receptor-like [Lytechinus pictus]|uniref:peroxisomal targeting signal 2 receptor-like n=1 Tax=Lytechinus pictus TaxID=7653 RepID=UPI0030B9E597